MASREKYDCMNLHLFNYFCYFWIITAVIAHILLFYIKAPFGRHTSKQFGPMINNKLGWFIMELPSFLIMLVFLMFGAHSFDSYVWILFVLWLFHYLNRTFIYPLRIKSTPKKMPLLIVASSIFFNVINAGLVGYYLSNIADPVSYNRYTLQSIHFIFGAFLFVLGLTINWRSDDILMNLRKWGETSYKIPRGFLFEYVTSPNLLGEIIEWTGFALMAWNLPAVTFMVWTFANLVPRAKNHQDWYLNHFKDYPKKRKIIFPFIF